MFVDPQGFELDLSSYEDAPRRPARRRQRQSEPSAPSCDPLNQVLTGFVAIDGPNNLGSGGMTLIPNQGGIDGGTLIRAACSAKTASERMPRGLDHPGSNRFL